MPRHIFVSVLWLLAGAIGQAEPAAKEGDLLSFRRLNETAVRFERAGEHENAAAVFEVLIKQRPVTGQVLAPRLVRLYAKAGNEQRAVAWARRVMEDNPDPHAYLAGVYVLLKDYRRAQQILAQELIVEKSAHRKTALLWQLADVCRHQGEIDEATRCLRRAMDIAPNERMAETTQELLDALQTQSREQQHKVPETTPGTQK